MFATPAQGHYLCGLSSHVSLAQTRTALEVIVSDLHTEDHFALITFDGRVSTWKNTLVRATAGNVSKAISYVKSIKEGGCQKNVFICLTFFHFLSLPSFLHSLREEKEESFCYHIENYVYLRLTLALFALFTKKLMFKTHVSVSPSATNINGAVLRGVNMLKKERERGNLPERSSDMIILLTDGMPNTGERVCLMK